MLPQAALLRFENPTEFGKPVFLIDFPFICLKDGLHSQAFYLSYAQLEEVMSWNTSVGFGCLSEPLLCRVLCCNHAY